LSKKEKSQAIPALKEAKAARMCEGIEVQISGLNSAVNVGEGSTS
jgi:hypothetical protein